MPSIWSAGRTTPFAGIDRGRAPHGRLEECRAAFADIFGKYTESIMRYRGIMAVLVLSLAVIWPSIGLAAQKTRVFVTIVPQAFLAERIGGEAVEVHILAAKGQDPHTFEPTPRQVSIDLRLDAFIPEEYITDERQRLALYRGA